MAVMRWSGTRKCSCGGTIEAHDGRRAVGAVDKAGRANLPSHEDVRIPAVIEWAAGEPHVVAMFAEGGELAPVISICFFVGILRG